MNFLSWGKLAQAIAFAAMFYIFGGVTPTIFFIVGIAIGSVYLEVRRR